MTRNIYQVSYKEYSFSEVSTFQVAASSAEKALEVARASFPKYKRKNVQFDTITKIGELKAVQR